MWKQTLGTLRWFSNYFPSLQKLQELIMKLMAVFWPFAACFPALRWRSVNAFETSFPKGERCCVGVGIFSTACQRLDFYCIPTSYQSCSWPLEGCDHPGQLYMRRRCARVSFKCFLPRCTFDFLSKILLVSRFSCTFQDRYSSFWVRVRVWSGRFSISTWCVCSSGDKNFGDIENQESKIRWVNE